MPSCEISIIFKKCPEIAVIAAAAAAAAAAVEPNGAAVGAAGIVRWLLSLVAVSEGHRWSEICPWNVIAGIPIADTSKQ